MMGNLKILNKKEIKRILNQIEDQWGFNEEMDCAFLENEKGKVYICNKEIFDLDLSKLKINSFGIYFADTAEEIRLSIEGSQIIGPSSSKNIVELDDDESKRWLSGEDIEKETGSEGFVLIKHGQDFLGTGKATDDKRILNFVPKNRRLH